MIAHDHLTIDGTRCCGGGDGGGVVTATAAAHVDGREALEM